MAARRRKLAAGDHVEHRYHPRWGVGQVVEAPSRLDDAARVRWATGTTSFEDPGALTLVLGERAPRRDRTARKTARRKTTKRKTTKPARRDPARRAEDQIFAEWDRARKLRDSSLGAKHQAYYAMADALQRLLEYHGAYGRSLVFGSRGRA